MQPRDGGPAQPGGVACVVTDAVQRDLALLPVSWRESGLAAAALSLAGSMDDPGTSATARAACARALREVLDRLRELCPPSEGSDRVDELSARREKRFAG